MYKKELTYEDYNGNKRKENFYFNLSEAEITELTVSEEGGLMAFLRKIVESQDGKEIFNMFKKLVLLAYGEKSLDGTTFDKSDEAKKRFLYSPAFSIMVTNIINDAKESSDFIAGIIPKKMAANLPASAPNVESYVDVLDQMDKLEKDANNVENNTAAAQVVYGTPTNNVVPNVQMTNNNVVPMSQGQTEPMQ